MIHLILMATDQGILDSRLIYCIVSGMMRRGCVCGNVFPSAQIGSGVVWGGPEVRSGFHQGSTRVPRDTSPQGFHKAQGSTNVP